MYKRQEQSYGYVLPAGMREHLSYLCKSISDHQHKELKAPEVYEIFHSHYFDYKSPIELAGLSFKQTDEGVEADVTFAKDGKSTVITEHGNGSLDAVSNALKEFTGDDYKLLVYTEHSMQSHRCV